MQNSKVTVVADDNGNAIRQSQNSPEYGFVRIVQDAVSYGSNGWVNRKQRSTLILGKLEDLEEIGFQDGQEMEGKIVVKESTEPFNATDPDRDLKIAGSTGIICCTADGEPIYRTTFYDFSGTQEDTLIAHANGDAIREANVAGVSEQPKAKAKAKAKVEELEDTEEDVVEEVASDEELEDADVKDTFEL